MTQIKVEVVPIVLTPHPNADSLSLVSVFSYPVIVRTEDWLNKTTGAYIPVDALVPETEDFAFLGGHRRIRAKKLRGIFSMGLLHPTPDGAHLGDDVAEILGVTKYEPPEPMTTGGETVSPPPISVEYTDIEHLRRYAHVLTPGESVIVTEKLHGANGRWTLQQGVVYAGSHHQWKKEDPASIWWKVVDEGFRAFLASLPPDVIVFGEVYGAVQDLTYGFGPGRVGYRVFDIYDPHRGAYLDMDELSAMTLGRAQRWGIALVPPVAAGYFDLAEIEALAEQDSVIGGPGHVMEGVVVRPWKERFDPEVGRVILKLHSQRYLLRKGG